LDLLACADDGLKSVRQKIASVDADLGGRAKKQPIVWESGRIKQTQRSALRIQLNSK